MRAAQIPNAERITARRGGFVSAALTVALLVPVTALAQEEPAAEPATAPDATAPDAAAADDATRAPDAPAAEVAEPVARWFTRMLATETVRVRAATGPDDSAGDLRLALDGVAIDPKDRLELKAALGLWWTFTGPTGDDEPVGWSSIHGQGSPLWLDVYALSLDYKPGGKLRLVRAGRQEAAIGQPGLFDGGAVVVAPEPRLKLHAFGGRTVHFFEVGDDLFEDWMFGAGAEVLARPDLKVFLDYRLRYEDVITAVDDPTVRDAETDHSYGASAWWRRSERFMARIFSRGLDGQWAYAGGAARALSKGGLAGLELRLDAQLVPLGEIGELDDPYHLTLGESLPYTRVHLEGWKAMTSKRGTFAGHLGLDGRFLIRGHDETPFNRNLGRAYLLLSGTDLTRKGPFANLTLEYVTDGLPGDEGLFTAGGAAGWEARRLRAELGSYYQRWKYIYYQVPEEISDVRGFYADARYQLRDWLSVRGRYSYEVFDRHLHTFTISITQAYDSERGRP